MILSNPKHCRFFVQTAFSPIQKPAQNFEVNRHRIKHIPSANKKNLAVIFAVSYQLVINSDLNKRFIYLYIFVYKIH
jgi:hypothetical protein